MREKDQISEKICRRCGRCCRKGGPGLHRPDLALFEPGALARRHVLTLRAGEPVFDNVAGKVVLLDKEMLRLAAGPDGRACVFLSGTADCGVYRRRPAECRALSCRDPAALTGMYDRDRLGRGDLLPSGDPLAVLVAAHEERCGLARIGELVEAAGRGAAGAGEALGEAARFDAAWRELCVSRAGVDPAELAFLFGRPLGAVIEALAAWRDRRSRLRP